MVLSVQARLQLGQTELIKQVMKSGVAAEELYSGIDAHRDGAAREQDVDVPPGAHCRSPSTSIVRAASTTAPPASVHVLGTSWKKR